MAGFDQRKNPGLDFPNLREVFGQDDYELRFAVAETLFERREDLFPKSPTCDTTKNGEALLEAINSEDPLTQCVAPIKHSLNTCYIGEGAQNDVMRGLSVDKLRSIRDEVLSKLVCSDSGTRTRLDNCYAADYDRIGIKVK